MSPDWFGCSKLEDGNVLFKTILAHPLHASDDGLPRRMAGCVFESSFKGKSRNIWSGLDGACFFFRFGTINTGQADVTLVLLVTVYFFLLTTWTMAQSG